MIGVTARLSVQPGKEAEFEAAANALIEQVRANEPGCVQYELFRTAGQPEYIFFERYADKAALKAHGETNYFKAAQAPLGACLAGPPVIEMFEAV